MLGALFFFFIKLLFYSSSFFFFFTLQYCIGFALVKNYLYLLIFGCTGSSSLHVSFFLVAAAGATLEL